jgi:hypothetical protein
MYVSRELANTVLFVSDNCYCGVKFILVTAKNPSEVFFLPVESVDFFQVIPQGHLLFCSSLLSSTSRQVAHTLETSQWWSGKPS